MNRNIVKELLYTIIAIMLGILIVRFVIWLLPIIIVMILAFYIYQSLKKSGKKNVKKERNIKLIHDDEIDGK